MVLLIGQFAALIDVTVTNLALPSIERSTGATPAQLQWIVSGYILAFGLMPIIGGRLGDARGRRMMFIIGLAGFVLASAAVGLSPDPLFTISARVVQGLFGGVLGPQISGYIQNAFPKEERGRAFGRLGLTVGVAAATGPVLGGVLIALGGEQFGWRLVFFINVPIGIVAIILSLLWVREPETTHEAKRARLDLPGALLLGLTIVSVLFPIVEYSTFHTPLLFLLLIPGALFGTLFLRRERALTRNESSPLLDLRLFRSPSFAVGVVFILVYFCGSTGLPLILTLYLQQGVGFLPIQAALAVTALAIGSAISAPIAGRLVIRLGRRLMVIGVTLFIIGALSIAIIVRVDAALTAPGTIILHLAFPLFLIGLGGGAVITPNQTLSLADVDPKIGGSAGGALQTSQRSGAAIGQASIGAIFFAVVGSNAASTALGTPAAHPAVYADALTAGVIGALVFAVASLTLALIDLRRRGRRTSHQSADVSAEG